MEGFKTRALSIEAGVDFKIVGLVVSHLRVLHSRYGMRIANPSRPCSDRTYLNQPKWK